MPGSGKTTLGKQLADVFKLRFIDLDDEIEKAEGMVIKEIFSTRGEEYFRKIESGELKRWAYAAEQFVMSTGGGAPCFLEGIRIINETGISIFLDVPVPELIKRLEKDLNRPLLQHSDLEQKLTSLRQARINVYQQAQITIEGDSTSVKELLEKLEAIKK